MAVISDIEVRALKEHDDLQIQQMHLARVQEKQQVMTAATERTSLTGIKHKQMTCATKILSKFRRRYCMKSKAVLLILIWVFIISYGLETFFYPLLYLNQVHKFNDPTINGIVYGVYAVRLLFFPLAGFLADVHWGRYTTVVNSLWFIFWAAVVTVYLGCFVVIGYLPTIIDSSAGGKWGTNDSIGTILLSVAFGPPILCGILLAFCSLTAFRANVIQFGVDQLQDSPTGDLVLYIHWYVWVRYVGIMLLNISSAFLKRYTPCVIPVSMLVLGVALYVGKRKHHWFLEEPGSRNPYRLVYNVIKFAKKTQ